MALVLILLLLMVAVHNRAIKLEKINMPALVSIEMTLALPIILLLVDAAAKLRIAAVLPLCIMYVPFLVTYTAIVATLAIVGLSKYKHDSARGGFLWCIAALPIAVLLCMIAVGNFTKAAQAGQIAENEREQQALIQQKREEAKNQELLYEPDRQPPPKMEKYSPADGSFSIVMPNNVREFACEYNGKQGKWLVNCYWGGAPIHGIGYCVVYYDRAGGSGDSREVETFINTQLLKNWQGSGRSWVRKLTIGNRVYKLMAISNEGSIPVGDVNNFLASFKDTRQ